MSEPRGWKINRYVAEKLGLTEMEAGWLLKCYYNSMQSIKMFTRCLEEQYVLGNIRKRVDPKEAWRVVDEALRLF